MDEPASLAGLDVIRSCLCGDRVPAIKLCASLHGASSHGDLAVASEARWRGREGMTVLATRCMLENPTRGVGSLSHDTTCPRCPPD